MNDLGALGSIEMNPIALDVYEFIQRAKEDFDGMRKMDIII